VPIAAARALAEAIPACCATFYADEGHDTYNRHVRGILTALMSGVASEQNGHETADSPRV